MKPVAVTGIISLAIVLTPVLSQRRPQSLITDARRIQE